MNLEDLYLKKEELPIVFQTGFEIPIHPRLLDPNIKINPEIAQEIFPRVADDWYKDLEKHLEQEKDEEKRDWMKETYLKNNPKITRQGFTQFMNGYWEDQIQASENGLVTHFSISRNGGGSLYYNEGDFNCSSIGHNLYMKFSEEKLEEFKDDKGRVKIYAQHNIDYLPGALFLKNWAIMYMNEVFKDVYPELH